MKSWIALLSILLNILALGILILWLAIPQQHKGQNRIRVINKSGEVLSRFHLKYEPYSVKVDSFFTQQTLSLRFEGNEEGPVTLSWTAKDSVYKIDYGLFGSNAFIIDAIKISPDFQVLSASNSDF